jgi:hypothetical protein
MVWGIITIVAELFYWTAFILVWDNFWWSIMVITYNVIHLVGLPFAIIAWAKLIQYSNTVRPPFNQKIRSGSVILIIAVVYEIILILWDFASLVVYMSNSVDLIYLLLSFGNIIVYCVGYIMAGRNLKFSIPGPSIPMGYGPQPGYGAPPFDEQRFNDFVSSLPDTADNTISSRKVRYCIKCGSELVPDGSFCPKCGWDATQKD